eukprot:scaffold1110_cov254-Pinguiococcus_pyrenoidosus.AAC.2
MNLFEAIPGGKSRGATVQLAPYATIPRGSECQPRVTRPSAQPSFAPLLLASGHGGSTPGCSLILCLLVSFGIHWAQAPRCLRIAIKLASEDAIVPTRGSPESAGYDLYAARATVIPAGGKGIVETDLSIACPPSTYARIAPRSGLAVKKFIDTGAGVVDADYRGLVGVVLFNFSQEDFEVSRGDRVAQLVLERICMAPIEVVEELSETARGAGGFGSTGVSDEAVKTAKVRVVSPTPAARELEGDPVSRMRLLEQLKTEKLISEEEYGAKRLEILGRL